MIGSNEANNLDQQIDSLMQCKPLKECEIKVICEKVISSKLKEKS